jgi:mycothiol synthase
LRISRFLPASASRADFDGHFRLELAATALDRPHDRPPTLQAVTARLQQPQPADRPVNDWVARSETDQIVGTGFLMRLGAQNPYLAGIGITVHPDHRRHGIGTALLAQIAAAASGLTTLMLEGVAVGGPGQGFADRYGFVVVQSTVRQSLDMTQVDRSRWQVTEVPGYRLARWTGRAPDDLLASCASARNFIASRPHGDAAFVDPAWSPGSVRADEAVAHAANRERRVIVAVHDRTRQVAGLTYLEVYRRHPELAVQQDTVVLPEHRGQRLGAWIKAASLRWLAEDRPDIRLVRTSTAADNTPMLAINEQVGFLADLATQDREASLGELLARLSSPRSPGRG